MLDSLAYWNGDVLLPGTMLGDWDGATLTEIPYPLLVIPDGYASVADMLSRDMVYMAHRGGSADYPEHSLRAYTQAAVEGFGCLEFSAGRTADGVYIGSGDNGTLNEEVGLPGSDLVIDEMTWAEVQTYTIKPPPDHPERQREPFMRWEQLVAAYGSTHVIMIDPKTIDSTYYPEMLDYMDANGGPVRWIGKWVGSNPTWSASLEARGYSSWGAYYNTDNQQMVTDSQGQWDVLGFNFGASQGDWDFILSFGKPVYAHVCPTQQSVDTGVSKGAVGAQVSGTEAVDVYKEF